MNTTHNGHASNGQAANGRSKTVGNGNGQASPGRNTPPYRPFPVEVLPEPLKSFVKEGSASMHRDPAMLATHALAAVGAAIGATRVLWLKGRWTQPPFLWTVVIAESGETKSPPYDMAMAPFWEIQHQLDHEHNAKLDVYDNDLARYRSAERKPHDPKKPPLPTITVPVRPSKVTNIAGTVTLQMLLRLLVDHPRGFIVARDELDSWIQALTRHAGNGSSDLPDWLSLWSGSAIKLDLVSLQGRSLTAIRAHVGITGTVQPTIFRRAMDEERQDAGLPARFLIAAPEQGPPVWTETDIHPDTESCYSQLINDLLDLKECDHGSPHYIRLSPQARTLWPEFHDGIKARAYAETGPLRKAMAKMDNQAVRLALVLHTVDQVAKHGDSLLDVSAETLQNAFTLTRWYIEQAQRVYYQMTETKDQTEQRHLLDLVRSRGGVMTPRDLQRCRSGLNRDAAECVLNSLASSGLAEWEESRHPHGGRIVRTLRLHRQSTIDADLDDDE